MKLLVLGATGPTGYREAEALGPGARLSFHGVEIPAEELL